jgi:chromosomal replication initiator protein
MKDQLQLQIDDADGARLLWERTLESAGRRLGREVVESWLQDAQPVKLQDGVLVLGAPNGTHRDWIEKKYAAQLAELAGQLHGAALAVQVVVRANGAAAGEPRGGTRGGAARTGPSADRVPAERVAAPLSSTHFPSTPLHDKYTFDNFVVGASNRFGQAAALAVANNPGKSYNPLFIYGGVGLGKTHLLQAIGQHVRAENPRARIAYISGETFTSHFVASLRESREDEFKRWYRNVDIWLVDDIQFIAELQRSSTKEEFFHTFNALYLTNRQIVLASDRPPRELRLLEDRLRSRMEAGLMTEIGEPELETRMAILEKRAALEGTCLPADVVLSIASQLQGNIRVLEAALIRLLALASLNRCEVTAELATSALQAFVSEGRASELGVQAVQKAVCEQFGVSEEFLLSGRRDRKTSLARQVAMYLMRDLTRTSLSQIGNLFGGKTHSTVLYACKKLEAEMKENEDLAQAIRQLCARLRPKG